MISETASQIPAVRLYMGHTVMGIQSKILRSVETQYLVFFSITGEIV